jgi:hypothetical protein
MVEFEAAVYPQWAKFRDWRIISDQRRLDSESSRSGTALLKARTMVSRQTRRKVRKARNDTSRPAQA